MIEPNFDLPAWASHCRDIASEFAAPGPLKYVDPEAPWSKFSLNSTETHMLSTWRNAESIPAAQLRQYEAYLGEGLLREFSGRWVIVDPKDVGQPSPPSTRSLGIEYPDCGSIDVVSNFVQHAYLAKVGNFWSQYFDINRMLISS